MLSRYAPTLRYGLACFTLLLYTAATLHAQDRPFARYAVSFDGANDFITAANDAALENVRSVELWFNPADQASEESGVVALRDATTRFSIHVNPNNNTIGLWNGSNFGTVTIGSGLAANTWYHLGIVFRATGTVVYLNGSSAGTISHTLNTGATGLPLVIGASNPNSGEAFAGRIDDVRLWAGELPASHFTNFRSVTVGKASTNLIAYYPLEASTGSTAYEYTGGFNGTLTNGPTWTTDDAPITGPAGALAFDGSDDYAILAAVSALDFAEGTVELYIKPAAEVNDAVGLFGLRDDPTTRFSVHLNSQQNQLGLWNGAQFQVRPDGSTPITISPGVWYHVAFVIDGSATEIFLNGASLGSTTNGLNAAATGLRALIGASDEDYQRYNGVMDELRIWNTKRTAAQLTANMNCELVGNESGLVGYFDFKNDAVTPDGDNTSTGTAGRQLFERVSTTNATLSAGFGLMGSTSNWVDQASPVAAIPCASSSSSGATTIYVDANATGADDGTSWTDAYNDLQDALAAATGSTEIWIAEGTYKPTSGTDRGIYFTITGNQDGLKVYGGFAGTETQLSERDVATNPVVLSGDIGTTGDNSDNSYHVLVFDGGNAGDIGTNMAANVTSATVLDGLTIADGNANFPTGSFTFRQGGGIYCDGEGSGNGCSPTFTGVTIANNTAQSLAGGAAFNGTSGGTVSPTFINCVFYNNRGSAGGALLSDAFQGTANLTIINSTFVSNSSSGNGANVYSFGQSGTATAIITNSIFYGNTGNSQFLISDATHTVSYSLVEGSGGSGSWNTAFGTDGGNNIDADPLFVNATDPNGVDNSYATSDDGLRLSTGSPALNVGSNAAIPSGITTDLVGTSRTQNTTVDMGAYEGDGGPVLPVELIRFTATRSGSEVRLAWTTATETNNAGFEVEWQVEDGAREASPVWEAIGFVGGAGTTLQEQTYSFQTDALSMGRHRFRLKQIDYDGTFAYSPEVEVSIELAEAFRIDAIYPNPFRTQAHLRVAVRQEQVVSVAVYDVTGRRIQSLYAGTLTSNTVHDVLLPGSDMAAGVYLVRVQGETFVKTQRVVLAK